MAKRMPRQSMDTAQTVDTPATEAESTGRDSKTRIKAESQALQELGWALTELTPEQIQQLELPDALMEAVESGRRMQEHGAVKRHRKFLGKLLRNMDATVIREKLAGFHQETQVSVRQMHRVEKIRDSLLTQGDSALNRLMESHPGADRQKLRQLVRNAATEHARQEPPRSARLLYRYIKSLLDEASAEETELTPGF